jgi:rubredoxin
VISSASLQWDLGATWVHQFCASASLLPAHASASASPLSPFDAAPKNEGNSQADYHQHTRDYEHQIHGQRLSQSSAHFRPASGDYNRIAVRHMTASPEHGPVVLIYGCSECNWIYRALTPEEAAQISLIAQFNFEQHDCSEHDCSDNQSPPPHKKPT